jgi:histidinol-phosphate aminotransferase
VLSPRKALQTVPTYHPPLAGRDGVRLDFNENTTGCSPRVLERLRRINAEDLARYPERAAVEERVAGFFGVAASELLLTNGVDEAIHLLCQTYLDPGDEAMIAVPTYSMYRIYMTAAGATVISVFSGEDFEFPLGEMRSRISPRTRLIAIANPNNPTGTIVESSQFIELARSAPHAAVLLDEAYAEFSGQSMIGQRGECPNMFVARTFSKAYGMAGLRIGALIGDSVQMESLRRAASPYNVNAIALACLPEALADQNYVRRYVGEVRESQERLEQMLEQMGISFWPSHANFILMQVGATAEDASAFVGEMRSRGILVRDRSSDPGCTGCVRITLGTSEQTEKLLTALPQALAAVRTTREASLT